MSFIGMSTDDARDLAARKEQEAIHALYTEANKLGMLHSPDNRILMEALLREPDRDIYDMLRERVERERRAYLLHPTPLQAFRPTREQAHGDIILGTAIGTSYPFGIDEDTNTVTLGITGSGKSVINRLIAAHYIGKGEPCVILSKKKDARSLARMFSHRVVLFRLDDRSSVFKYNPIEGGPGIPLVMSNSHFADIFCYYFQLMAASKSHILLILAELDHILGTDQDSRRQPSLFELEEALARRHPQPGSKDAEYTGTVHNRVQGILATIGPVVECSLGLPIETLLAEGRSIIIEVDAVNHETALFIESSLSYRLFNWMLFSEARPKHLRRIHLFCDDAHEMFHREKEHDKDLGLPPMGMLCARIRTAGTITASTQVTTLTSDLLLGNCRTKIAATQPNMVQAKAAANQVGLLEGDAIHLMRLGIGEAVIFKPRCPYPVPVRICAPEALLEKEA